jgi:hypothetical protein
MADTFMAIFGYKRVKPTDEELKHKERDISKVVHVLNEITSNKH